MISLFKFLCRIYEDFRYNANSTSLLHCDVCISNVTYVHLGGDPSVIPLVQPAAWFEKSLRYYLKKIWFYYLTSSLDYIMHCPNQNPRSAIVYINSNHPNHRPKSLCKMRPLNGPMRYWAIRREAYLFANSQINPRQLSEKQLWVDQLKGSKPLISQSISFDFWVFPHIYTYVT